MTEGTEQKCQEPYPLGQCDRTAIAEVEGRWLCMLHLPLSHPQKTLTAFTEALRRFYFEDLFEAQKRNGFNVMCQVLKVPGLIAHYSDIRGSTDGSNQNRYWILQHIKFPRGWNDRIVPHDVEMPLRLDLSGGDLCGVTIRDSDLRSSDFYGSRLVEARFEIGSSLQGADLSGADLTNASLIGVDLHSAYVAGAILRNVRLTGARLEETDLGTCFQVLLSKQIPSRFRADDLRVLRSNFVRFGHQELADQTYLEEQRTRRRILWEELKDRLPKPLTCKFIFEIIGIVKTSTKWLGSILFDVVAKYGNSAWRALWVSWVAIFLCAGLYALAGLDVKRTTDYLFHSVLSFTTLGISGSMITDQTRFWPRIITALEAFAGAAMMALFVFSLGRKALR